VEPVIKNAPQFKIGTSTRDKYYLKDKFKMELPPPNIYTPKFDRVRQAAPATSLGYGTRSSMNKTFTAPGPGNYLIKSSIGEGPKFGMRIKLSDSL